MEDIVLSDRDIAVFGIDGQNGENYDENCDVMLEKDHCLR